MQWVGGAENHKLHKGLPQSLTSDPFEDYVTELGFEFVCIEPGPRETVTEAGVHSLSQQGWEALRIKKEGGGKQNPNI